MTTLSPLGQLQLWLEEATRAGLEDADAMVLATATRIGTPSARVVSCRGIDEEGIRFFTNYESRKASELSVNPSAALVFFWPTFRRQVRVEGAVTVLPAAESDAYFQSRPRGRQLAAWASPQSRPIASLDEVRRRANELAHEHEGREIPRPPFWGGFLLRPNAIELWIGGEDRLHERRLFVLAGGSWIESCLGP